MRRFRSILATAFVLLSCHAALAGAPLKGIDVKLGKNPGGLAAARTTDANGQADFGVVPKGDYTLEFSAAAIQPASYKDPEDMTMRYRPGKMAIAAPAHAKLHVVILGLTSGRIERDIDTGASTARTAPIGLSLSGKEELTVLVTEK